MFDKEEMAELWENGGKGGGGALIDLLVLMSNWLRLTTPTKPSCSLTTCMLCAYYLLLLSACAETQRKDLVLKDG